MKPRGDDSSSRSCSCTSCFYKSESEHHSMRRMLAKGSRIDKLFIGKYLPLREEKLLNRLVRTRAIYDDIRTQLLSDSNVSESDKSNLKSAKQKPLKREGKRKDKELSDVEQSSVLFQLVNLVDKGATLGPHRLSECCSCCVCGSKTNKLTETGRLQKHKHRHASSRSSFTSGMRTRDERRLGSHGHRARYIRSDPVTCTCTHDDDDSNVRGSRTIMKKDQKPIVVSNETGKIGGRHKIKGYKTRQGMGETLSRSMTKLKMSKSQMSAKLRSKIKKSTAIMKTMEQRARGEVQKHTKRYKHSEILYSLRGGKHRKKTKEELELEVQEAIATIKKDSLAKIREDMKKKKKYEKWACECDLEKTNIAEATARTESKKQDIKSVDLKKNAEPNEPQNKSITKDKEIDCECKTTTLSTNISEESEKSIVTKLSSTTTKTSSASETIRQKRTKPKATIVIQTPNKYTLKRCLCTLKLKPKRHKPQRPQSSDSNTVQIKTSKTLSTTASTPLKRIEQRKARTKSTSSPMSKSSDGSKSFQAHSSEKVEKLRPSGQLVINRKKYEPTSNKQAVRISSSFSFNIEFYKDTPSKHQIDASEIDPQSQVDRSQKRTHKRHSKVGKHNRLAYKPSPITSSAKTKNTQTKHNLRRCLCTLKFGKKDIIHKYAPKAVTYSKGTLTSGQSFAENPILRNTNIEKRLKRSNYYKYQLPPFECQCLELIKKRNAKQTSRSFGNFNRKTRSTYSITTRRGGRSKTKKVQSVYATHKEDKSLVIPQRKVASSPSRQAVRIESSFSFDIKFYKDKPKDTQQDIEIAKMKIRESQQKRGRKHQKSISVQSNTTEKGILIESAIKRCLCTIKLQKNAKKQVVSREYSTTTTEIVVAKGALHPDMVTRSTQMKKKRNRQLEILAHECECGTETIRNKYKSIGLTTSSSSQNALTQSNLGKTRKKRKRSKYTTSSSYPKLLIPMVSSRQAVRLESSFSFNVEFSKDRPQEEQLPDELLAKKPIRNVRVKQNAEHPIKSKLKHNESQSVATKKMNKGSRIKSSILKKCFCTLKLQNKKANLNPEIITKPIEAIVMPAHVFNKSFALNQYRTNNAKYVARKKNIEQDDIKESSIKLNPAVASKLNTMSWISRNMSTLSTEFPFNLNKPLTNEERGSKNLEINISKDIKKTTELNLRRTELIGVSPYLKKSFYALNLHVQNHQRKTHKLLPYECEPGVCVPGECDPYECQKWINKRLIKKSSTMTTTGNRSESTSSDDTHVRSLQQQFGKNRQEKPAKGRDTAVKAPRVIKTESPPNQSRKQAVRVGSTFSFDIEFFKDKSPANKGVVKEKRRKDHNVESGSRTVRRNHKSTRGSQVLRRDKPSQTSIMTHEKGQNITRPKRCFCTLKLQKRGKQEVQVGHEAKPPLQYTNTGQNTKCECKFSDLDPNECEPGVCVPGECDPFECLERIKKRRKHIGSTMRPSLMSSSSMTSKLKHDKGEHAQINEKRLKTGGSKSIVSSVSKPSDTKTSAQSSRQAVRIGSSFSFNVEFHKDRSHGQDGGITGSGGAPVKIKTKTKSDKQNTRTRPSLSSIGRTSPDSTALHHQDTQHSPNTRAVGTKTGAFLKRCFCTAKFLKKSPPNDVQVVGVPANVKASPSLMQRCLCTLKLLTAKSKSKHALKDLTGGSSQTLKIKENKTKPMKLPKLDPNECEPGVCVPGQCDPYKCLERINRRKELNKMSSTKNAGTKSTSIGFRSPRSSKSVGVSYASKNTKTTIKKHDDHKKRKLLPVSTPVVKPVTANVSPNRNIVRIGSSYSFNVEFYKDKISPTYLNIQRAAKEVKKKRHAKSTGSVKARRRTENSLVDKYGQQHSSKSQTDFKIKKGDRATATLKRCFCTLALHKHSCLCKGKEKVVHQSALIVKEQGTESPHYKTYPNVENKNTITKKPYKLEPYECEPGVCIPGKCDPYECLKRIQRRREQSTSTPRQKLSSSSTLVRQRRKSKDYHAQSVIGHKKVARPSQQQMRPSNAPRPSRQTRNRDHRQHRQAVKIGSNFSFNIEFSKGKTGGEQSVKIRKEPKVDRNDTRSTSSKPERKRSTRSTRLQRESKVRDSDSQVLEKKVQSTLTETKPFLKRCFCTLKFKNIDKKSHIPNKNYEVMKPSVSKHTQHRDMGISTTKEKPFRNLQPYECEPGVCVPGQCDPYECLKRIEKKYMQTKMAYTERHRDKGVSTNTVEKKTLSNGLQNQTDFKHKKSHGHVRERKVTAAKTHSLKNKKVVRIGSSFSFDAEFFKNKSNKVPFHTDTANVYSTLIKTNNITTNPGLKKYGKVMCACTSLASSGRKLSNRLSQSISRKTASTGSAVSPLLQRCFCTLKLQKLGRLQRPSRLRTNSKVIKKPISTNKRLDSTYKCTDKCLERKKRRNMSDSTANCNCKTNSVSSLAGRKSQIRKLQTSDKFSLNTSTDVRSKDKKRKVNLTETGKGDRQAVNIGSNFSFDIEFIKDKNVTFGTLPKIDRAYNAREEKFSKASRGSFEQSQSMHHKKQQAIVLQEHKSSGSKPILQRCFCTLKVLEGNKQHKPPESGVQVGHEAKAPLKYANTGQNTKKCDCKLPDLDPNECEPGVCIPGNCDVYECLERIKRRNNRHMATTISRNGKPSLASFTPYGPVAKSKKTQCTLKRKKQEARVSNIVEQPRFPLLTPEYYQGLKIGSNVSFNIEFYKECALPDNRKETNIIARENKKNAQDRYDKKGVSIKTNVCKCMHEAESTTDAVKTEDKSCFVGNALKRCFCTAKLAGGKNIMTVGRVDKLVTNSPFQPRKLQIYQMHQAKQNDICHPNCVIFKTSTKNAATRVNDKYFSGALTDGVDLINKKRNKNADDMKTILPYAPKKFNKSESKTLVNRKRKSNKKHFCACCTESHNKDDASRIKSSRRLTGKQEKTLITNQNGLKRFMCTCLNIILKIKNKSICNAESTSKRDDENITDKPNLQISKSERNPNKKHENKVKKSKSLNSKNYEVPAKPCVCPNCQADFDNGDYKKTVKYSKTAPPVESDYDNKSIISEVKKAGGDVRISKNNTKTPEATAKGKKKYENKIQSEGQSSDVRTSKNAKRTPEATVKGKKEHENKCHLKGFLCNFCKDEKKLVATNPDAAQQGLKLTKQTKLSFLQKSQDKNYAKCECSTTQSKKVTAEGMKKKIKTKPCFCGSSVCAKEAKKEISPTQQKIKLSGKPCVCKSPVCAKDAKKKRDIENKKKINKNMCVCNIVCECSDSKKEEKGNIKKKKKKNKENIKKNKKKKSDKIKQNKLKKKKAKLNKLLAKRRKEYAKVDRMLMKQRLKKEYEMYKQVVGMKGASDCALLTESMFDIAKLGCATTGDILRSTCRTIMDPRNTAQNIKICALDPKRGVDYVKQAVSGSGLVSTCKRIKTRFGMMQRWKGVREELESRGFTNYLLHMFDKDPKKRMKPRKRPPKREQTDFKCSPYMTSLRKRPWLSVYRRCPWFYPHCISMLNIWKQFTDILMFLLAVLVWSPCIMLMEFCRAMMCCFLCTG